MGGDSGESVQARVSLSAEAALYLPSLWAPGCLASVMNWAVSGLFVLQTHGCPGLGKARAGPHTAAPHSPRGAVPGTHLLWALICCLAQGQQVRSGAVSLQIKNKSQNARSVGSCPGGFPLLPVRFALSLSASSPVTRRPVFLRPLCLSSRPSPSRRRHLASGSSVPLPQISNHM